jgi:hypothetical protein
MRWGHLKILLLRTMKPKKAKFHMKAFWHRTKASWLKSWHPSVEWGKWKWNAYCISIWAKVTQESDVAHGPLVS